MLPVTENHGLGVLVGSPLSSGWLSGAVREGREITTHRSNVMPQRFDLDVPANRAKLDAVEQVAKIAADAGLTMIQLALGFVTAHPGVTTAIIGPRTMEHLVSQLAAADTVLSADLLDAIDAIVAPRSGPLASGQRSIPDRPSPTPHCGDDEAHLGTTQLRNKDPGRWMSAVTTLRGWRDSTRSP